MTLYACASLQILKHIRPATRFASTVRRFAVHRRDAMPPLTYKEPTVVPSRELHTATVFILHGLGDCAEGLVSITGRSYWGRLPHVKFIIPTAPVRPVTLNYGLPFTAWYDVVSLGDDNVTDEEGIAESCRFLSEAIEKEIAAGIPSDRIVIVGYSMGGGIALSMLRSPHKFAAILGISTYLPICKDLPIVSDINKETPVLMCHGKDDQTIAFIYGQRSFNILEKEIRNIRFEEYPIGHEISEQELRETAAFLESVLPQI